MTENKLRFSRVFSLGMIRSALAVPILFSLALPASAFADVPWNATIIADIAEQVTPAVVNITTKSSAGTVPFEGHPMLKDFFGPGRRRPMEVGAGSGVVISADGYIVTNNHVIKDADEIKVTFADKREFYAKLIGTDSPSDIALIKIEAAQLPFLSFGSSASLRLGEIVLAVGNPFGVGQTVTMGIVSAKGRSNMRIIGEGSYEDFIQTDAAINPGNSGGALVNLKGELVGINTAILSKGGGSQGIGFAVPSSMVRPVRDALLADGRVRRGWLGVAIQDLTPEIMRNFKLNEPRGVLISDVMAGGPASKAKMEPGDVVTRVNDQPAATASELRNTIALMKPGSKVKLAVTREGKKLEITAQLDEKPDQQEASAAPREMEQRLLSGLQVEEMTREQRARLSAPANVNGVVIVAVEEGSPAEESGLQEDDVITAVNKMKVKTIAELTKLVPKTATEALLRVWRNGNFTFVVLKH
jgi:serine protease Do